MQQSFFKDVQVSRGLNYHYYYTPASSGNPTLLFLHGYPSSSYDWHRQVTYFGSKGYGILVPDMIGSGGTSKPLDSKAYRFNLIAKDVIDILDAEHLDTVVGIGHDWGSVVLARLSMLYSERFLAFGWIALSFMEPITYKFDLKAIMAAMKQLIGYEGYAYWEFLTRKDAPQVIKQNVDSFIQLIYPKNPDDWRTWMASEGKTSEWMDANMQPGRPDYLTEEEYNEIRRNILAPGCIPSSLNWYISQMEDNDLEDNLQIPKESWHISKPSFYAAATRDPICTPARGKPTMAQFGKDVTTVDFPAGHWVHLEETEAVNRELEGWLKGF